MKFTKNYTLSTWLLNGAYPLVVQILKFWFEIDKKWHIVTKPSNQEFLSAVTIYDFRIFMSENSLFSRFYVYRPERKLNFSFFTATIAISKLNLLIRYETWSYRTFTVYWIWRVRCAVVKHKFKTHILDFDSFVLWNKSSVLLTGIRYDECRVKIYHQNPLTTRIFPSIDEYSNFYE